MIEEAWQSQALHRTPVSEVQFTTPPQKPTPVPESDPPQSAGRSARRVRTRMLGFDQEAAIVDPIDKAAAQVSPQGARFPVAWIVVADGPGREHSFTLYSGVSTIGRGDDQTVVLDLSLIHISEPTRPY